MENDSISTSSSESKLPLIVGIIGFALGAAGLVLGIKAKSAAQAAQDAAAEAGKQAAELSSTIASKASAADVQAIAADLKAAMQAADANNALLKASIDDLQKVVKKPVANTGDKKTDGGNSKGGQAGPGQIAVAKGDTLSSIAKKAGISLKALQDLNPSVNANKLQIGQILKTK
jgi:LysM repeat protein